MMTGLPIGESLMATGRIAFGGPSLREMNAVFYRGQRDSHQLTLI